MTDASGMYVLPLPPGTYTIEAADEGYVGSIRLNQIVGSAFATLDLDLVPLAPTPDQQAVLYSRIIKQTATPLVNLASLSSPRLRVADAGLPATIAVYYDTANPPYTVNVPLEDYVKCVIPNEVPWNWPTATLQAQAVACRSYGVASYLAYGYVYPDTRSQVYDPTSQKPTTNAAADATAGQVMTYNGAVIWAFFYSRCNAIATRNSEDAIGYETDSNGNVIYNAQGQMICTSGGWNYVAYCRSRSCGGHDPSTLSDCGYYGHGVGMCQWGAYARGGSLYQTILNDYYTSVAISTGGASPTPTSSPTPVPALQLLGPFVVLASAPVTLSWRGPTGIEYAASLYQGSKTVAQATLVPNSSGVCYWSVGTLPVGSYAWTVAQGGTTSPVSATLIVATKIYQEELPWLNN
jgi:hypothetical protein